MKILLALCCLLAAVTALPQPQPQSIHDRIREKLFNSKMNPCGAGVKPSSCACPNGTTFTPGSGSHKRNPCGGSGAPTCTCPDGSTFTPDKQKIKNMVKEFLD